VLSIRDRVYRLSLRMTARPPDAEDGAQEILIRVITQLSTFRFEAAFSTWVHRIAVNHLLDRSKIQVERQEITFDTFADDLAHGLASSPSAAPDAGILEREVQLACTHAMLMCLDREHRIAHILGEVFEVDSDEGGYICGVPSATYRKRLSRARSRVRTFLTDNCGLDSPRLHVVARSGWMSRCASGASTGYGASSPTSLRLSTTRWSASTTPLTCSGAYRRRGCRPRPSRWSRT
jgi:RNA polymerase sigma factor (sigma-70 family)